MPSSTASPEPAAFSGVSRAAPVSLRTIRRPGCFLRLCSHRSRWGVGGGCVALVSVILCQLSVLWVDESMTQVQLHMYAHVISLEFDCSTSNTEYLHCDGSWASLDAHFRKSISFFPMSLGLPRGEAGARPPAFSESTPPPPPPIFICLLGIFSQFSPVSCSSKVSKAFPSRLRGRLILFDAIPLVYMFWGGLWSGVCLRRVLCYFFFLVRENLTREKSKIEKSLKSLSGPAEVSRTPRNVWEVCTSSAELMSR